MHIRVFPRTGNPIHKKIIIVTIITYNVLGTGCDLEHYKFMGILPLKELPVETRYLAL